MTTVTKTIKKINKYKKEIVSDKIEIEQENIDLVKRWFRVKFGEYRETVLKVDEDEGFADEYYNDGDEYRIIDMTNTLLQFTISIDIEVIKGLDLSAKCFMYVKGHQIGNFDLDNDEDYKTYLPKFEEIKREYEYCICGAPCFEEEKQCKNCYIYNKRLPDNCAICLENNYRWITTNCNHNFHRHCMEKVENKNVCPLCRGNTGEWKTLYE